MRLSKSEREAIKAKFGGRCAYCGETLGDRWHADHFEPVVRGLDYTSKGRPRPNGKLLHPERNCLENMMPACAPCNIDKGPNTLEWWRGKLQGAVDVLTRNNPTYRHARRFGLVTETGAPIIFYFERSTHEQSEKGADK